MIADSIMSTYGDIEVITNHFQDNLVVRLILEIPNIVLYFKPRSAQ